MKNITKLIKRLMFSLNPQKLDVNVVKMIALIEKKIDDYDVIFFENGKNVMDEYYSDDHLFFYTGLSHSSYITTGIYNGTKTKCYRHPQERVRNDNFSPLTTKNQIKIANKILNYLKNKRVETSIVFAINDLYQKLRNFEWDALNNPNAIKFFDYETDLSDNFKEYHKYTEGLFNLEFATKNVYKSGEVNFLSKMYIIPSKKQ